jgi:hypothetical protein
MADAAITLQATNLFDLATEFKTSSSSTSTTSTNVTVVDEVGNVDCERNITDIVNYSQSAGYCGTDFDTDFTDGRAAPVPILANVGSVYDSKMLTGVTINMTAGEYCTVDLEGHNHDNDPHDAGATPQSGGATRATALLLGIADFSGFFIAGAGLSSWDGFGVPSFGIDVTSGAAPSSATLTLSLNHVDQIDSTGSHLVGKNITPRLELSMDFSGIPTDNDITSVEGALVALGGPWADALCDSVDSNDSNSDFDSFSFTAHAPVDLATA